MTDIKALKALAEAATPGPWHAENERHEGSINSDYRHIGMVSMHANVREDIPQNFANQEFIAAANPAAVLELIAEIERLHFENGSLRGSCKTTGKDLTTAVRACNKATKERDQLKAENFDLGAGKQAAEEEIVRIKAENEMLRGELGECCESLHGEMLQKFGGQLPDDMHPVTRREYDRDMAEIACYRAVLIKESDNG
ncbi:ead/Ea22-like family protein [Pseudomonas sp. S2_H01]